MSDFFKNMTFWKFVGVLVLIGAAGFAVSRVIMAMRGTSPEAEAAKALADAIKGNNPEGPKANT